MGKFVGERYAPRRYNEVDLSVLSICGRRGKQTGRPRALTKAQIEQSWSLREAGFGPSEIAKLLGCSRATVYRALDSKETAVAV